jgi:beta-glucosidase
VDRSDLDLPGDQNLLISAVAAANHNTVVVLNTGGAVLMPWLDRVKSVIEAWLPGQEDGQAIAALLFGDVNFSGRLPITWPASPKQGPGQTAAQFRGINNNVSYSRAYSSDTGTTRNMTSNRCSRSVSGCRTPGSR